MSDDLSKLLEIIVNNNLKAYVEYRRLVKEESPTNTMGSSSATGSPIAGFDPVLKLKMGRGRQHQRL